jgi:hypothetical protein
MHNPALTNAARALSSHQSPWQPKYPFDLVIAYEDTTTRNRALNLYDHLAQELLDDHDFQCSWWKFSHLANDTLMRQASEAAAQANMIVVSVRAGGQLPDMAQRWLNNWLPIRGDHKSALVSMIAGTSDKILDVCPIQSQLHRLARGASMDFFSHRFDSPLARFSTPTLAERANLVTPLMEEILETKFAFPRFGINE